MAYELILELDGLPKTLNQMLANHTHWSVRKREADRWENAVMGEMLLKRQAPPAKPLSKARIVLTRFSSREPDWDGKAASWKHVVDALIKCGVIEDDSSRVIGWPMCLWEKAPVKQGKIRIEVYEA